MAGVLFCCGYYGLTPTGVWAGGRNLRAARKWNGSLVSLAPRIFYWAWCCNTSAAYLDIKATHFYCCPELKVAPLASLWGAFTGNHLTLNKHMHHCTFCCDWRDSRVKESKGSLKSHILPPLTVDFWFIVTSCSAFSFHLAVSIKEKVWLDRGAATRCWIAVCLLYGIIRLANTQSWYDTILRHWIRH